ncbi:hypothetical protein ABEB36_014320 [Hypothenemus hampei]|uniref:Uncharacterized protein n=1 Tax=Hypothenemus hampei TaxID=57062 RepID=A0ABD1E6T8_HYPHA
MLPIYMINRLNLRTKFVLNITKMNPIHFCLLQINTFNWYHVKNSPGKKKQGEPLTSTNYRRIKGYDILTIGDVENLIKRKATNEEELRYIRNIVEVYIELTLTVTIYELVAWTKNEKKNVILR